MASAKVVVLQLPEVEIERFALTEYLRAVLHTIVFHRSLGVVTPVHESSELFQAQWCSIGMAEVSASVEDAVEQLSLDSLQPRSPTSAGGSVTLSFHTKTTVASLIGLGGTTLRKQFEEWRIPFLVDLQPRAPGDGPADTLHRQRRQADLEKAVRSSLLAVATLAVKQADHVPAVDFAVKAPLHFGFTINVPGKSNPSSLHSLRAQAVSGGRAGASADTAGKPATTTPAPDEASPAAGGFMGGFSQLGSLMSRMLTTGPPLITKP